MKFLVRMAAAATALLLATAGCSTTNSNPATSSPGASGKKLQVVATTGYLGDAVKNIAPEAQVSVLVAPGGDPHTQALSTADAERVQSADVVVWTSHDMEHHMMEQLDKLGKKQVAAGEAIPEADLLPWKEDGQVKGHDPHVWNSPDNWTHVVTAIAKKLSEIDAPNAAKYQANAEAYNKKIMDMKKAAEAKFAKVPQERRILITGHDAFNYLGKAFGIEIHATDFVSTEAQISAAQIDELATLVATKKVPVIFQDNLGNPAAIQAVKEAVKAKGWKVEISDTPLYADSLGESAPTNTYLGVFEHNVDAIVKAMTA